MPWQGIVPVSYTHLDVYKRQCIYDTPLSKDETEVESLCKAFPNAKIFISEDKVQNIDIKEE